MDAREEHLRHARAHRAAALATEVPDRLLCIVGETASGKTELAMDVCERIGGEIVSADSVQVYRGFDLGSGKPTAHEQTRAPHHLIDILDPDQTADAMTFTRLADAAIRDIRRRNKIPIVCGGTFFWVRALVLGLAPAPSADESIRARHKAIALEGGTAALHEALARVDKVAAARLHPNDVLRVSRALEVWEITGRTMTEIQTEHGFATARTPSVMIGIATTPEELSKRIERRVDAWLAQGWIDEVRELVRRGHARTRAMGSVGYASVLAHLDGTLEGELRDVIVRTTRIFARKQRTWLKSAPVEWL